MVYIVKYEIQKSNGKIVFGEMPVEAEDAERAELFAGTLLDAKYDNSLLLECQVVSQRE
jgi:hypothetical protein